MPFGVRRTELVILGVSAGAFLALSLLFATAMWYLWRESIAAEAKVVGRLASTLGARTEAMILDTRNLLETFDELPYPRCSREHLQALQDAVIARPYVRAVGYFRAAERTCGVGFLQARNVKPPKADRIYESGVVAWWPSPHTEVGGLQLFLMRYGDHDAAIDPRVLIDLGPLEHRQAGLWVEKLRLTAAPADAQLPRPDDVPIGVTIDRAAGRVVSRFSRSGVLPIDIVAIEPLSSFWDRHVQTLAAASGAGLVLVAVWTYGLMRYTRRQLSPASLLRRALARGRIHAYYQPTVELATGRCAGAEVLARWKMKNGDVVEAASFIPVAETAGLLPDVTRAVLDAPLGELREFLRESSGFRLFINLSAADLDNPRFSEWLDRRLKSSGVPARAIGFEITERALVNTDAARDTIRTLRARGHTIAVDDFGTGYSSLSYLSSFELDVLKIDKSFVDAIGTESATSHVIVHVIEMARSLGLRIVAEGVEREDQARWLRDHGVDYAQGFLFGPPLPSADFAELASRRKEAA
jgi:sensor c-di-GMP phosphodiesterase-like protein